MLFQVTLIMFIKTVVNSQLCELSRGAVVEEVLATRMKLTIVLITTLGPNDIPPPLTVLLFSLCVWKR